MMFDCDVSYQWTNTARGKLIFWIWMMLVSLQVAWFAIAAVANLLTPLIMWESDLLQVDNQVRQKKIISTLGLKVLQNWRR
jgi:hypothetical protein